MDTIPQTVPPFTLWHFFAALWPHSARAEFPRGTNPVQNAAFLHRLATHAVNGSESPAATWTVARQVVPEARFELAHPQRRRILSPLRLPFRHSGHLSAAYRLRGRASISGYSRSVANVSQAAMVPAL